MDYVLGRSAEGAVEDFFCSLQPDSLGGSGVKECLKDEDCVGARGVELGELIGACDSVDGGGGKLLAGLRGGQVGLDFSNWAVERTGDLVEGLTGGRKEDSTAVPREGDGGEDGGSG